jgi:hypothetical protein
MVISLQFLRSKAFWIVIIFGLVLLYPIESTVLPSQNVLVVTEDWRPVQGATVRQIWQHYSLESRGHEDDMNTDQSGRVVFPGRTIRSSILNRVLHPFWNILTQGMHASFGVHTDMFVVGGMSQRPTGDKKVEARPEEVVFRLRK